MPKRSVKRGEIYYYDFGDQRGSVQGGIHPALVLQGDAANKNSPTTVVAVITSRIRKPWLPSHVQLDTVCGLKKPSMVQLGQIHTVNQRELLDYIGHIEAEDLQRAIAAAQMRLFELHRKN